MAQDTQIICPKIDECREVSPALIKHILVPFDESQMSYRAFEFALDLAKKYNAKISIITVMFSGVMSRSFIDMTSHQKVIENDRMKQISHSSKLLQDIAKRFGVEAKFEVKISNNVSDTILSFSSHQRVGLIVMGTRARNSPNRFLIGSVAIDVIQKAVCPVILVK
ncbi:MAG: universal stress protein [Candidatus Nitrosotenuis sp.]|nr:universal stress protein [Candidatus Nitrosotenuis sp.]